MAIGVSFPHLRKTIPLGHNIGTHNGQASPVKKGVLGLSASLLSHHCVLVDDLFSHYVFFHIRM
jgi:hypothetical protein